MADQTNKFNTGSNTTSTILSSQLPGTVNLTDSSGKLVHNGQVNTLTNQVIFTTSFTCTAGIVTLGAEFTGDGLNAASKNNLNFSVGGKTSGSYGQVTKIVAGPGIYISSPNGDGVVTISLEPFHTANETENLARIVWTQTDNSLAIDTTCFIAVGGGPGVAGQVPASGVAVRSRDGDNWVDINNKPFSVGLGDVVAVESADVFNLLPTGTTGTGQVYFSNNFIVNAPDDTTLLGLYNVWGIEGRTDVNSCAWCSDGLDHAGNQLAYNGAPPTPYGNGGNYCFYKTGSIVNDSLFLLFNIYFPGETFNATSAAIWRYTDFPTKFGTSEPTDLVPIVKEYESSSSDFRFADSNLLDNSFSSYKVFVADSLGKRILGSNRSGKTGGSWSTVYSGSNGMEGITYVGGGRWVACGGKDTIVVSTDDGATWHDHPAKWPGSNWLSAASGHGYVVIVGTKGRAVYSQDGGITWSRAETGTTKNLNDIAFSPKLCQFVAVGDARTIIKVAV